MESWQQQAVGLFCERDRLVTGGQSHAKQGF